jgi:Icc-related predicted phosphoesterase
MSDLHLDQYEDNGKAFIESLDSSEVDVLALNGDILSTKTFAAARDPMARICDKYKKARVLFTPGNHDYWDSDPVMSNRVFKELELEFENLTWMNNRVVDEGGQRFLGGTMWFRSEVYTNFYRRDWHDFERIKNFVPWVYDQNEQFIRFIDLELREGDIVLTHYLPSYRSVPLTFQSSPHNGFFVCDMEGLIAYRKPKLWLHGHTHNSCDYEFFETRIVCNPRGNKDQWPAGEVFTKKLVIEV